MTSVANIIAGEFSSSNRITAVRKALVSRIAKQRVYRKTLNELRNLSVRELDDLGMNQDTLKTIAHEAAYK